LIQYSHFSPLSGLPDTPENYHTVTVELSSEGIRTLLSLSQDNNPSGQAREHSEKNWRMMLTSLKKLLESSFHGSRVRTYNMASNDTRSVERM
jgi:hypothetical protein